MSFFARTANCLRGATTTLLAYGSLRSIGFDTASVYGVPSGAQKPGELEEVIDQASSTSTIYAQRSGFSAQPAEGTKYRKCGTLSMPDGTTRELLITSDLACRYTIGAFKVATRSLYPVTGDARVIGSNGSIRQLEPSDLKSRQVVPLCTEDGIYAEGNALWPFLARCAWLRNYIDKSQVADLDCTVPVRVDRYATSSVVEPTVYRVGLPVQESFA